MLMQHKQSGYSITYTDGFYLQKIRNGASRKFTIADLETGLVAENNSETQFAVQY